MGKGFLALAVMLLFSSVCIAVNISVENLSIVGGDGVETTEFYYGPDENSFTISFELAHDFDAPTTQTIVVTVLKEDGWRWRNNALYEYRQTTFFPGLSPTELDPFEGFFGEEHSPGNYVLHVSVGWAGQYYSEDLALLSYSGGDVNHVSIELSKTPERPAAGEDYTYNILLENQSQSTAFDGNISFRSWWWEDRDMNCSYNGRDLNEDQLWRNGKGFPLSIPMAGTLSLDVECTVLEGRNRFVVWVGGFENGAPRETNRVVDFFSTEGDIIHWRDRDKIKIDFLEIKPNKESYSEGDDIIVEVGYKNVSLQDLDLPEHKMYVYLANRDPVYQGWWYTWDTYGAWENNIPLLSNGGTNTITINLGAARTDIPSFQIDVSVYQQNFWWVLASDTKTFSFSPFLSCDVGLSETRPGSEPNCVCEAEIEENKVTHACTLNQLQLPQYMWMFHWGPPQTIEFYINTANLESVESAWTNMYWGAYPDRVSVLAGAWIYGPIKIVLVRPEAQAVPGPGFLEGLAIIVMGLLLVFLYARKTRIA